MKNKADISPSFVKMDQARKLMDEGRHQESLVLAMEVLLQELDTLRDSLQALQTATRAELLAAAPQVREEPSQPELYWLPATRPRVLH
jgi:hypothetical protein